MVHADTILESLVEACKDSPSLPNAVTYSTIVLDSGGDHSNVRPPVIEFSVENINRDESRNTEKVGVETDDSGTEIGYIFTQWFDLEVQVEITTVSDTDFTHRGLSQDLGQALYPYDTHGPNQTLPDPNLTNEPLYDVNWVVLDSIQSGRDFSMSPSARTRNLQFDIGFTHEFRTSELGIEYDVVENIQIPTDAVASADGDSIELHTSRS